MSNWQITFNGKEVRGPWAKVLMPLMVTYAVVMVFCGVVMAILGIFLSLCGVCVALPLDPILKKAGRKGFIDKGPNHLYVKLDLDGFRRSRSPFLTK